MIDRTMLTTKPTLGAVTMAALLVLAGCSGPISSGTATPSDAHTPDDDTTVGRDTGTVELYISDEEHAIDEFAHLNVTITKVGFHRIGAGGGEETGETATANATATVTANETVTATPTEARESEEEKEGEEDNEGDRKSDAHWVEYDVNATVDLTELQGANATKLDSLATPNGSYDKVFIYVSDINATLKNGEQVNVKLPSSKLQLNKGFTIGNGESVQFVYDISVFKAGKSGKYILKPVVSQSGMGEEVDIEEKGEKGEKREKDENDEDAEKNEQDENETKGTEVASTGLNAEFVGPVKPGKDATLKVTGDSGPVVNATVTVNGGTVGTTDDSGTVTFTVPKAAEKLKVKVTKGDSEAELERELNGGDGNPLLTGAV